MNPNEAPDGAAELVTLVVGSDAGGSRLDRYLAGAEPSLSRARWQQLLKEDRVELDGKTAKPNAIVRAGDRVSVWLPAPVAATPQPEAIALPILYEDSDIVVVDKPAGLVVHPGAGHATGTLVNALLHHCHDLSGIGGVLRPGIVHRLDKDTSGVIVAAKNDRAHRHLADQFAKHSVERAYIAVAWGLFRQARGTFMSSLERDPHNRLRMTGNTGGGRTATTHYEVTAASAHFSHLICRLETGRTHQIRVHCAEAGHPLVGDPIYGKGRSPSPHMGVQLRQVLASFKRQALHAAVLGFDDLHGRRQRFETAPPDDMQRLWTLMESEDRP